MQKKSAQLQLNNEHLKHWHEYTEVHEEGKFGGLG